MRKTTRMAVLCILWAVSTCAAAEPKLVNEKQVFPKGDPMWKTPRQYNLWAMRLSPDGKHLLYPRTKGEPPLTPEGAPDFHKMQYEMVLRNLSTAKDTVLPINPLKSGWRTVFTRFNMFDPAGKKLALANIVVEEQKVDERLTSVRTSMRVVLYDITTGKISKTNIKDPSCIAKFDRTGKGLIGIKGRRSLETFTSDSGGLKLKPLPIKGFLQSVCPTADVICVCAPPERGKPAGPGRRPERGPARLFLYDIKAGKEVGQLPMHQRNSKLDDWETQWTADGRYLYYYDVREVTEATVEGPREKIRPITRVWDRLTGKQSGQVFDTVPIGPGPTAMSMILAKRDNTGKYDRFLLHDAKTGADHPLGETGIRPIHAWGKKVLYAKKLPDGKEAAYIAEIDMEVDSKKNRRGSRRRSRSVGKVSATTQPAERKGQSMTGRGRKVIWEIPDYWSSRLLLCRRCERETLCVYTLSS